MIKIEFPADRPDIAAAIGRALSDIAKLHSVDLPGDKPAPAEVGTKAHLSLVKQQAEEKPLVPEEEPIDTAVAFGTVSNIVTPPVEQAAVTPEHVPDSVPRDKKGVPFDIKYCAQAADPFYGTGKQAGQWKKRKGVSEETYDAWYSNQLALVANATVTNTPEAEVNTAIAFGSAAGAAVVPAPQTAGELMAWISEKQVAKLLNQSHLDAAFASTGAGNIGALFPPRTPDEIAQNVAKLYAALSAVAGN